jgi:predicted dehydrogenase
MGRRHLRAYGVLDHEEPGRFELAAVIDPEIARAEFVASEAEQIVGARPAAFARLEDALAAIPDLDVVDIVAAVSAHHAITRTAVAAGLNVLCEKPMAPTVAACRAMQSAVAASGCVLSIAENYRRDPMSRLAHALITAGAIGEVRSVLDVMARGGNRGDAGAWRYLRKEGGPILEAGVHNADMLLYLCGPVQRVSATVRLNERERQFKGVRLKVFHDHYADAYPDVQVADAPDILMANFEMAGGSLAQWLYDDSAHGPALREFRVFGSAGQLELPNIRNGRPLRLFRDGQPEALADEDVLRLVPDFALDNRTARLFGGERLARYDNEGGGAGGAADLKLLALELGELLDAIDTGAAVEISADAGLQAVAVVMACHEASAAGRWMSMAEVVDGSVDTYQRPVNVELGV